MCVLEISSLIEPALTKLSRSNDFTNGLFVGQRSLTSWYLLHIVETKQNQQGEKATKSKDGAGDASSSSINMYSLKSNVMKTHVQEVTQMLPGGLNVLGFFFIGSVDVFEDREFPLNKLLMDFRNELSRKPIMYGGEPASEILVYFKNSQTGKNKCFIFGADSKGKPVSWVPMQHPKPWSHINCRFKINEIMPIPGEALPFTLKQHFEVFMTSLYKSITNATFLFDEQKKDGSFPIKDLQVPAKKKEYKYQQKPSNSAREYSATIILHDDNEQEGLKIVSAEVELWFKGSVVSQVIIHSDAVVKEAEEAVKSDILRTLSRRLDMHWHSLVEEDINSFEGEKMVHEPPRRVLFPLCDNSITFSDHLFPGEDVEENVDLINSTFNVHLNIADVQEDLEQHDKSIDGRRTTMRVQEKALKNDFSYKLFCATLLIIVISVFIHFMLH